LAYAEKRQLWKPPVFCAAKSIGKEMDMSYEQILFEVEDQLATITLNRPERLNAYTPRMLQEIIDALQRIEGDDSIRVSILTGAGRGFCAGADLESGEDTFDPTKRKDSSRKQIRPGAGFLRFMLDLKKPVIAAINGPAVGVGISLLLTLDIRIAAESARIGLVFNRRGVLPEYGSPWFLPRMLGFSRAAELLYTGRILSSREALEYGLVSRVVPDDELLPTARELGREIAVNCAPVSIALTKHMLWQFMFELDIDKVDRINKLYFDWSGQQPDAKEGIKSFLEKRPPKWSMKVSRDMPDFFPLE
jgi:enoyl-CoA hydratase/carnithine racemase